MGLPAAAYQTRPVEVVGVACGFGAPDVRCEAAPEVLAALLSGSALRWNGKAVRWSDILRVGRRGTGLEQTIAAVVPLYRSLSASVCAIAERGQRFVVIGGDHGGAIGTWSGAARAFGRIGLVWLDAHLDSHTPAMTPSGNLHGMPLACLLGVGDPRLIGLGPRTPAHARARPRSRLPRRRQELGAGGGRPPRPPWRARDRDGRGRPARPRCGARRGGRSRQPRYRRIRPLARHRRA
ncbi:MAG: hypothetical protein FJX61_06105 [Alphaproteobacteria bacterium]|nr:hypothetical protein [Alphaproteobacteria bacterium]